LAEGRDTAVKRGGCDDRHGREVKKIRWSLVMCDVVCGVLASCLLLPPPCSLHCGDSTKNG
jgi:hypothetical protein